MRHKLKKYKKYIIWGIIGIVVIGGMGLFFMKKNSKQRKDANSINPAVYDFKIQCPGEGSCDKDEVTVTNIGKKSYSDLLVICKDKDNPHAPDTEPYYTWPFTLEPGEKKCMSAVNHCLRTKNKNKKADEPDDKYVTLLQIDSKRDAIWMKPYDCPQYAGKK